MIASSIVGRLCLFSFVMLSKKAFQNANVGINRLSKPRYFCSGWGRGISLEPFPQRISNLVFSGINGGFHSSEAQPLDPEINNECPKFAKD